MISAGVTTRSALHARHLFAEDAAIDNDVLAGDVMITGTNDAASLTALQNSLVELNEVATANEGLLYGSAA